MVEPFRQVYDEASEGQFVFGGEAFTGNFSGLVDERVEGSLNEFVPETIEAAVGRAGHVADVRSPFDQFRCPRILPDL